MHIECVRYCIPLCVVFLAMNSTYSSSVMYIDHCNW